MSTGPWIGAVDQGTTSTRFLVFDSKGTVIAMTQRPVLLKFPASGWVELDPQDLVDSVVACIDDAAGQIERTQGPEALAKIKAIGITNQRETTIAWDADTGLSTGPAIVWMDTRTRSIVDNADLAQHQKRITGLPKSTYFSAGKMQWILENDQPRCKAGRLKLGTVDSWLLWNLLEGSPHVMDITNAHRTALMDIERCKWSEEQLWEYRIDQRSLPQIKSSAEYFGKLRVSRLKGVPVTGVLGDQHAALLGHGCTEKGDLKATYGTGCFVLSNTGEDLVRSDDRLLSTIAFQLGPHTRPHYALEGPIANAGSAVEWLVRKAELLKLSQDLDVEAADTSDEVVFVPSLSGSLAPRWNPDARGAFLGLQLSTTRSNMIKSVIDSIAFSVKEVIGIIKDNVSVEIKRLVVDGGLSNSNLVMQTQANVLGIPVERAELVEATAFGAAKAAAIGLGLTDWPLELKNRKATVFMPQAGPILDADYDRWKMAVERFSRKDHEVLQKAAEARKQGKRLPEYDDKGELINPYIPMYIAKAPWYMKTGSEVEGTATSKASLEHQRITEKVTDSSAHHVRGFMDGEQPTRFRKGACENCGAITHKKPDCLERPRKRGAKWTGANIRPDEYVQEAALDFEGKRDRWAGYDEDEYAEVIQAWEKAEEDRKAAKKEHKGAHGEKDDSESSQDDEDEEEDIYAEAVDMPGQKVDLKTRMTVRNLRLREDTAKYLTELCADPSLYDPKTRSLRRAPSTTGDNEAFVSADIAEREGQVFAWEMHANEQDRQEALLANKPSMTRCSTRLDPVLEKLYGSPENDSNVKFPELCAVEESDKFVEFDLAGRIYVLFNSMRAVEQNTIIAKDSIDELRSVLIAEILTAASAAIATQERFVLTLSGGSMVDVLCCPEFHSVDGMDYRKWVILLADERALPRGHPENTYSAYKQRLPDEFLEQVSFPDPFHSQLSIEAAAEDYAAWIGRHQITLDLVLLGVGPDGHTASLFPPVCPAMLSDPRTIIPVSNSPKPPAERISMSLSFLKSARLVIHVASGPSKHQAVERITKYNDMSLPPSHIPGIWLIDKAAFTGC